MGQNVNYLLGGQSQLLGADPELYRQQLVQQEQARIAAMPQQNQLGATIGSMLGRGIANVAQDRNFFEVTNPVLQKLTKIQDIYDTSMKASDPNDPMSFYTNLQKNFASAGLGQQALMASVEAKKFEDMGLKTEAAKTELYKKNPALLDTQIAKARDAGDDKLANQLAEQRGQIQIQIDTDRAMDFAKLNLVNAQTATQRAQAGKLSQEIESGKFDWKVINDVTGTPTHMAKINKKTGETTYEPIALPGGAAVPGAKPTAPKAGERPPLTSFGGTPGQPTNAAPAPVATPTTPSAPMAAAPTTVSLYDQATQTYKLTQDPEYIQIVDYARQNAAQIGQDPVLRDRIGQAMKDLQAKRQAELGSFVKFQ